MKIKLFFAYFVFYYYIRRLGFVPILAFRFYSKALRKYLVPGNFLLLFSWARVIVIFFFQKYPYTWDTDCEERINFQIEAEAKPNTDTLKWYFQKTDSHLVSFKTWWGDECLSKIGSFASKILHFLRWTVAFNKDSPNFNFISPAKSSSKVA